MPALLDAASGRLGCDPAKRAGGAGVNPPLPVLMLAVLLPVPVPAPAEAALIPPAMSLASPPSTNA